MRRRFIRIATPWHNGKVERSHRTDAEDFHRRVRFTSVSVAHRRVERWNHRYNNDRPHGALGWETPTQGLHDYQPSLFEGVTMLDVPAEFRAARQTRKLGGT